MDKARNRKHEREIERVTVSLNLMCCAVTFIRKHKASFLNVFYKGKEWLCHYNQENKYKRNDDQSTPVQKYCLKRDMFKMFDSRESTFKSGETMFEDV